MGWLDWLRPTASTVQLPPDVIWLAQPAKLTGIRTAVEAALPCGGEGPVAVVVAHFPAMLETVRQSLDGVAGQEGLVFALADDLDARFAPRDARGGQSGVVVVCVERHPLAAQDAALVESLELLGRPVRLIHQLALDDALFRIFAGSWVTDMLRRMGMHEGESIRSAMVSRRLRGAQERIAKTAIGDAPAESAEEWLRLNAPSAYEKIA